MNNIWKETHAFWLVEHFGSLSNMSDHFKCYLFVIFKKKTFLLYQVILTVCVRPPFVCVVQTETCKSARPCSHKGKHVQWYTDYFLIFIIAKLVFKLELSKYVYCTLELYTGADIQPKSLYIFSSNIFTKRCLWSDMFTVQPEQRLDIQLYLNMIHLWKWQLTGARSCEWMCVNAMLCVCFYLEAQEHPAMEKTTINPIKKKINVGRVSAASTFLKYEFIVFITNQKRPAGVDLWTVGWSNKREKEQFFLL